MTAPDTSDRLARMGASAISRRGLRLAGAWAAFAAAAEVPHVLEDSRAGVGGTLGLSPGVVGLLGFLLVTVGAVAGGAALAGWRAAARPLLAVAAIWIVGVLADHGSGLVHPTTFRSGLASSLLLYMILVANALAGVYALAPALPRRIDALKIDAASAWAEHQRGAAILLDVRTPAERRRGRIPGAVTDVRAIRARTPVAVVCSHGGRSLAATRRLRAAGIAAHSVAGGTTAWRRARLPWTR